MALLLGIDTGGTYTDAALYDSASRRVLRSAKAFTTKHDLAVGIGEALRAVLPGGNPGEIGFASLSTTLATNTIVEGHGSPVCLLLIGQGAESLGRSGLGEVLKGDPVAYIPGGHSPMGEAQQPLDEAAARAAIEQHAPKVSAFAVAGYFATRNPSHERAVAAMVRETTGLPVTCSHELTSNLDAPRRALTTTLNARLIRLLHDLVHAVQGELAALGIDTPLMVVKGDGSLVSAEAAILRPVETILSGPAASVVGATHLSGLVDAFVADIGGTTTDIALIRNGHPRLNGKGATVGGWRTMVEAIDVTAIGLGGDSEVHVLERATRPEQPFELGPRRALPLSLLALRAPSVETTLAYQAGKARAEREDGLFIWKIREAADLQALSRGEQEMLKRLHDGPVSLGGLQEDYVLRQGAQRLVERGLAIRAAFTPSDAAHLRGDLSGWSLRAAELGAEIWRKKAQAAGWNELPDTASVGAAVYEQLTYQAAQAVAAAAATAENPDEPGVAALVRRAARKPREGALLSVGLRLGHPLVAAGASAGTYFPAVGERLATEAVVPLHAEVCNAVGAVVGAVIQRATVLISSPLGERYRVHLDDGGRDFTDLERAYALAEETARRQAFAAAERAGAGGIAVTMERDDLRASVGGTETFIESRVRATAVGRPMTAAQRAAE